MNTNTSLSSIKYIIITISFFIVTTSCKSDDESIEDTCIEHFNYDDTTNEGPANWFNYCVPDNVINECGSVVRQSPIDIVGAVNDATLKALSTTYANSTTDIINNGHTIVFNYNGEGTLNFDGIDYKILQFHFHTNSEHTINGLDRPLEVHIVHESDQGGLGAIGVFFEIGSENTFLAQFIDNLPEEENESYTDSSLSYNAVNLLPTNKSYYSYKGSLTTPPCSEIIEWIVMENSLEISPNQMAIFSGILQHNFRLAQPLAGRTIGYYSTL